MRLGATIDQYLKSSDPEAFVAECAKQGYRSASCPPVDIRDKEKIRAIREVFSKADIVIGEVQAWVSALDSRPEARQKHRKQIAESIAVADEVGAVCCVTVAGTLDTRDNIACDTPHPDNFLETTYEAAVEWIRAVLKDTKPRRTKLSLEMSPWTLLDGPEIYLKLIKDVDHPALAVHVDPSNAILYPRILWSNTARVNQCFDLLGPWVVSCHAKDLYYAPAVLELRHVNFIEVIPGRGVLDYKTFIRRAEQISPDMPMIIEHLRKPEEYAEAASYIRRVGREVGARV